MNKKPDEKDDSLTLEVLGAVENKENLTQRHLAMRMGVALGLANSYLKRCVNKGLVKVKQIPANRYLYYLTPKGFAEKTRLTAEYLTSSFGFYRKACDSCVLIFEECAKKDHQRILLAGCSELAEIANLKALDVSVEIVGIWDADSKKTKLSGKPVINLIDDLPKFDVIVITELVNTKEKYSELAEIYGKEKILLPGLLRQLVTISTEEEIKEDSE